MIKIWFMMVLMSFPNAPSVKHTYQNIPVSIFNRQFSVLYSTGEILVPNMNDIEINKLGLTSLSKQFETKSSYAFGLFDLKERYLGTLVIDYVKDKYVLQTWTFVSFIIYVTFNI